MVGGGSLSHCFEIQGGLQPPSPSPPLPTPLCCMQCAYYILAIKCLISFAEFDCLNQLIAKLKTTAPLTCYICTCCELRVSY